MATLARAGVPPAINVTNRYFTKKENLKTY